MARRLVHDGDSESGEHSITKSNDESSNVLLTRRNYVALGTMAAALGTAALGTAASSSSDQTTYWTDFSEGQL